MIEFTVQGVAVPYIRMTQGQVKLMRIPEYKLSPARLKVRQRLKKYFDWKEWVYANSLGKNFDRRPKRKIYVDVFVYFQNKAHGDVDNVLKGIYDSLFENDKMVAGSMDFDYDATNPRCEIRIHSGQKEDTCSG
jgi:hypothetical protein